MTASIEAKARELFAFARTHDDRAILLQAISDGFHNYKKRDFRALVNRENVTLSAYSMQLSDAYELGNTLGSLAAYNLVVTIASEGLERGGVNAEHE